MHAPLSRRWRGAWKPRCSAQIGRCSNYHENFWFSDLHRFIGLTNRYTNRLILYYIYIIRLFHVISTIWIWFHIRWRGFVTGPALQHWQAADSVALCCRRLFSVAVDQAFGAGQAVPNLQDTNWHHGWMPRKSAVCAMICAKNMQTWE